MSQQEPISGQQQVQQPVQQQQPTQSVGGQQQSGTMAPTGQGAMGGAGQVGGVGGPQVSREELLQTVRSLHNFETVLEIARVHAIQNGRPRIARVAGDLIAITEAEKKLVIRQSPFAAPIGEAVKTTIQQGIQQLQQQAADDPDIQAALSEASPVLSALRSAVPATGGFQQGGVQQQGGAPGSGVQGQIQGQAPVQPQTGGQPVTQTQQQPQQGVDQPTPGQY